jgi:hypothetical protein
LREWEKALSLLTGAVLSSDAIDSKSSSADLPGLLTALSVLAPWSRARNLSYLLAIVEYLYWDKTFYKMLKGWNLKKIEKKREREKKGRERERRGFFFTYLSGDWGYYTPCIAT